MSKKKSKEEIAEKNAIKGITQYLQLRAKYDIEINEEIVDGVDCTICSICCEGYTIKWKLSALISSIAMEFSITYPECDIEFSLNDVFNTLDINDFNDYFFDANIESTDSQHNAVDEFLSLIGRYDYDIKKAGDSEHIDLMCNLHNEDKSVYDNENVKIRHLIKLGTLEHKMRKTKSEKDKNAYIDFIKKREQQYGIDNYTKRYIKYLEAGYPIPDLYQSKDEESSTKSGVAMLKAYAVSCVMGIIIAALIFAADRLYIMQKGIVTDGAITYVTLIISGIAAGYFVSRLFASKIMCRLLPDADSEATKEYYKKRFDNDPIVRKIFLKYLAPFFAIFMFFAFICGASANVCVTENSIIDHSLLGSTEILYENATVYYVKGFDYEGEYEEYKYPCYAFEEDGKSGIVTGELKNEKQRKLIEAAIEKHGIKPIAVEKYGE